MEENTNYLRNYILDYMNVIYFLNEINYAISKNITIQGSYPEDSIWLVNELDGFSKDELIVFANELENEFISRIKSISNSFNAKLYLSFKE